MNAPNDGTVLGSTPSSSKDDRGSSSRSGLAIATYVLGGAFAVIFVAAVAINPGEVGKALVSTVVSLLMSLNLRVVLGLAAAVVSGVIWSRALSERYRLGQEQRFGVTRHWGGLGSGEGGWEVDPLVAQWFVRVVGATGLSIAAISLLLPALNSTKSDDSKTTSVRTASATTDAVTSLPEKKPPAEPALAAAGSTAGAPLAPTGSTPGTPPAVAAPPEPPADTRAEASPSRVRPPASETPPSRAVPNAANPGTTTQGAGTPN